MAVDCFGDDKAQDMRKAVVEPLAPMRCRIGVAESGPHPDFAVTHLGGAGRHVVCPQIKGTATRQIEAGVVPVAGQGAVLDAAAIQRKAHMRAAIVECEDTIFVVDDEYRSMRTVHDQPSLYFQLLEAARVHEIRGRCVHELSFPATVFAELLGACALNIGVHSASCVGNARSRAVARPMPRAPPVTTATWLHHSIILPFHRPDQVRPARSYAWSINRTTRAQSCTLILGPSPRCQQSSASRTPAK